ncbi:universal stress protein [Aliiroseovarius subalbicans]|uniref:universal stress protein n=1 Tax=Aliiroseovarius subalbicans TaxID=2925840 RepID=UPI001F589B05|nr:universal stress protein [Aliiroseovarius subalbicans]MCI2399651.1 universal stress protein [Aliiroseovarius subalbicans]
MFKTVLIPVDVTIPEETQKILATAKGLSACWGSELHVATIVPDVGMAIVGSHFDKGFEEENRHRAHDELDAALAEAGIKAETHVMSGTVYDRVIALANKLDADLIVFGASRPELKDYLLGSNAARLVRHSNRSVLVLRD